MAQSKRARPSLNGVGRTKYCVQNLDIGGCGTKREQIAFHALDVFGALLQKGPAELAKIDLHSYVVTVTVLFLTLEELSWQDLGYRLQQFFRIKWLDHPASSPRGFSLFLPARQTFRGQHQDGLRLHSRLL